MQYDKEKIFDWRDLKCPQCGSYMELLFSDKYRYRNGDRRPFYRCIRFPDCDGTHGAHPNGAPLGVPANEETRQLRIQVHAALEEIYPVRGRGRERRHARNKTSQWLRDHKFPGHVSELDAEQCRRVLEILESEV